MEKDEAEPRRESIPSGTSVEKGPALVRRPLRGPVGSQQLRMRGGSALGPAKATASQRPHPAPCTPPRWHRQRQARADGALLPSRWRRPQQEPVSWASASLSANGSLQLCLPTAGWGTLADTAGVSAKLLALCPATAGVRHCSPRRPTALRDRGGGSQFTVQGGSQP